MGSTDPQRPRTPGILFAAAALVLVIVVGVFGLTARRPSPPTIAEFAPQASEQILTESEEQGFEAGHGATAATPTPEIDPETGLPTGSKITIDVARVRAC